MSPCQPVPSQGRSLSLLPLKVRTLSSWIGITIVSLGSSIPALAQLSSFEDIRGHWSQLCVQQLAQSNVVSAFRDASFRPDLPLSRELYADLISRAFPNVPETRADVTFLDVSPLDSQFEKIHRTYRQGFFSGVSSQRFAPTLPVSREAFFVVLAKGLNYGTQLHVKDVLRTTYDDGLEISPYAQSAVAAATERGIVVNYPNVRDLRPQDSITRAEAAAVLCQIRQNEGSQATVPPQYGVELPSLPQNQSLLRTARLNTRGQGTIVASLSYNKENYAYQDLELTLTRQDTLILHQSIPMEGGFVRNLGLQLQDLDGDEEPEVLLSFFAGTGRCCSYSLIYSYLPRRQEYGITQQSWGYGDYLLVDLDQNGIPEIQSRDSRFTLQFADSIQDAASPLQIWNYRQGQFFDVTRLYPTVVKMDTLALWETYRSRQRQFPDLKSPALKPVLAAYVANKFILDEGEDGFSRVEDGYHGSDRSEYLRELREFLRGTGYTNH